MSFSAKPRMLILLHLLLLLPVAWAGNPNYRWFPEDNNLSTNGDDKLVSKVPKWHGNSELRFYLARDSGYTMLPLLNDPEAGGQGLTAGDLTKAIQNALTEWNNAPFHGTEFVPEVLFSDQAPDYMGMPRSNTVSLGVDGLNLISFLDEETVTDSDMIAVTRLAYFSRDFKLEDLTSRGDGTFGFDPGMLSLVADGDITEVIVDINLDGTMDFMFPLANYSQGDVVDIDILFNSNLTPAYHVWPDNRNDVSSSDLGNLAGSLDIQGILMGKLGLARGLSFSLINDAVMNQYWNPSSSLYPTDPYRKRKLTFDDEMTLSIVEKGDWGNKGTIRGRVLDGSVVDGVVSESDSADEYVVQVPVYLGVRPEVLANSSTLAGGQPGSVAPQNPHPDNVESDPLIPDANAGTYRLVAQVLTGQNLEITAGSGFNFDNVIDAVVGLDEDEDPVTPPAGNPDFEVDAEAQAFTSNTNSNYSFPGLPPTDDLGAPIDYCIFLGQDVETSLNAVDSFFTSLEVEADYPEEFYGGPQAALNLGTGSATDTNNTADNFFENNFISVEFDRQGRFSAAINDGPGILSGFNGSPRSYVVVNSPSGSYSNKFGNLGVPSSAVIIDDVNNTAQGTWTRTGDFSLTTRMELTDKEGANGLPTAFEVSHIVTNLGATAASFSLRQVLDTYLFGTENPLYAKDDGSFISTASVLSSGLIPDQLLYQTSKSDPAFSAFMSLRLTGAPAPSSLVIAQLQDLGKTSVSGAISGTNADNLDTGVAINYDAIQLAPGESTILRFIVGFKSVGTLHDTWANPTTDTPTADQDDPEKVDLVQVTAGSETDGIDIITNTGVSTGTEGGQGVSDGFAAGPLRFLLDGTAIPSKDYTSTGGKLADVDNDGDLDLIICAFGGGTDPVGGSINRLLLNQQRINRNGTVSYFFQDVTFGSDNIPGTADDRMPAVGKQTMDVAVADFDGDGDVDLFFSNSGAPHSLYVNDGEPTDPSRLGFFSDASDSVLPPGVFNGFSVDNGWRCVAGDIDNDGDFDLIISQSQMLYDSNLSPALGWVDSAPRDNDFPLGDGLIDMESDLFTAPMGVTERVLINMVNTPQYATATRGFYFVDETLGADDKFGTLFNASIDIESGTTNSLFITRIDPADIDRMPPVFPAMFNTSALDAAPWVIDTVVNSPQGMFASEPRLGPFASDSNLDLFSVRTYESVSYSLGGITIPTTVKVDDFPVVTGSGTPGSNGLTYSFNNEPGFFRNVDLWKLTESEGDTDPFYGNDGIADGYFACINFNMDYGLYGDFPSPTSTASGAGPGLFIIDEKSTTTATASASNWVRDAWPLFIGMPEGHPADFTPTGGVEGDTITPASIGGWAGLIADLTNEGAPVAVIAGDNDATGGDITSYYKQNSSAGLLGYGAKRGGRSGGLITGVANSFIPTDSPFFVYGFGPYAFGPDNDVPNEWVPFSVTDSKPGEPYGIVAGDYDHDGDQDLVLVFSTVEGITTDDVFILTGTPTPHQVLLNDSYSEFTEQANTFVPNPERVSMNVIKGDIDNDSDLDVIVFNALASDQVFLNDIYDTSGTINLKSQADPTLFYEVGSEVIPPDFGSADAAPFITGGELSGVDLVSTVGDWNMDGRPDIAEAEGGQFSLTGGAAKLFFNRGESLGDAVSVFQPAGAEFPGPRLSQPGFNPSDPSALYTSIITTGFINDIVNGDFDGDGAPDMLVVRTAPTGAMSNGGAQLYLNVDSDDPNDNTIPDPDLMADGIFTEKTLPSITTPGVDAGGLNLKLQGRKGAAADIDNDGDLDIIIANARSSGGAPNLLLINHGGATFTDGTETNLPLSGVTGVFDNTQDLAVADFDGDGDVDIIFFNESNASTMVGFRYLENNGSGVFTETAVDSHIAAFLSTAPRGVAVADFDNLGEWTEDKNFNGYLDPGEDLNANGLIDFEDKPDESTSGDINGDGIVTKRTDGVWDGSLDLFVSMDDGISRLLINDPTNTTPGKFTDQTSLRIPEGLVAYPSRGVDAGDINLDGLTDIVVAQYMGGLVRPVRIYLNQTQKVSGGNRAGYFKDITYEVPKSRAMRLNNESALTGEYDGAPSPWANDVDLIDFDLDGDLDMYITTLGNAFSPVTVGAADLFYVNRTIGDGFNYKPRDLARTPGSPLVYFASPSGALRSQLLEVTLTGENFDDGTEVSFGSGIQVVSKTLLDDRRMKVQISVAAEATLGPRRVTVASTTGGNTSSSKLGLFYVYESLDQPIHNAVPDRTWTLFQ